MIPDYYRARNDVDGFAAMTIRSRLPEVIRKALLEPQRNPEERNGLNSELAALAQGLRITQIPLCSDEEPYWSEFFRDNGGLRLEEAPFFAGEAYFYRRLLNHISGGPEASGPRLFFQQKIDSLDGALPMLAHLTEVVAGGECKASAAPSRLFMVALNGNAVDLSQLHVNDVQEVRSDHLLVDDRPRISDWFSKHDNGIQVAIIVDNSGPELHSDLLLALGLLNGGQVTKVVFHLKRFPTFVSDATRNDVLEHLARLDDSGYVVLRLFAKVIRDAIATGSIVLRDHSFWNSPLHFTALPMDLLSEFRAVDLVISKGDANYRRFFEDRMWPEETDPSTLLDYFPTSLVHLRMLKCELALGLDTQQVELLDQQVPSWRTNGAYGVIAFRPL